MLKFILLIFWVLLASIVDAEIHRKVEEEDSLDFRGQPLGN